MMLNKKNKKGFTLIELLVVISIIAVLVSVVLVILNNARNKNNDAKVIAQLDSVRKNAALYFSTNGNYGIPYNFCVIQVSDPTQPFFQDSVSGMSTVTAVDIYPTDTMLICRTNGQAYAVAASISNGKRWCVDSTGVSKQIESCNLDASSGLYSCDASFNGCASVE